MSQIPLLSGASWTGHMPELGSDPLGLQARFNRECGDLGRLSFYGFKVVVVNSPALVEELLVAHARHCRKSRVLRLALEPLLGEGLFTSEGELWRRQRKLMAPLFPPAQIGRYAAAVVGEAARRAAAWSDGATIDVVHEMTAITMEIAGKTLFDADLDAESDALGRALTTALAWVAEAAQSAPLILQAEVGIRRPILWPSKGTRALREALALLEERVRQMIADRRSSLGARDDLLARLLTARDDDDGHGMTDRQLRDEILTLFVAGHETTATALSWAFYLLARHPEIRARLEAEVDALGGAAPRVEDLPRLPLASRVFKESLRMYPPVPVFERQTTEPITIAGLSLKSGAYLAVFPWALHHRADLWPEPDRFDPDRFDEQAEKARPRHAFVPFGAGPRVCIGNHFALMEGPLVLAVLLQHARLDAIDHGVVMPDPRAATLRPLGGIAMRVQRRCAQS